MIKKKEMVEQNSNDWFETWFDSPYYHMLYKPRSGAEASLFIKHFVADYAPASDSIFLDLACGKGRLSVALAKQDDYEVIGLDLSQKSIEAAQQYATEKLSFFRHDMRKLFRTNYFDYIFNFFTSFGYFEDRQDDRRTIENVHKGLKKGGYFIMDFLNIYPVISNLKTTETIHREGIDFQIERSIEAGFIFKKIRFQDKGKSFLFQERVRAFSPTDLKQLLEGQGFSIEAIYGNYELAPFDEQKSPRVILFAKK